MTIERLSYPDGIKLESDPDEQALRLIVGHAGEVAHLSEGDYDLTPTWWTKHLYNHRLTVLADGTGLYRLIPREPNVGTVDPGEGIFQRGGGQTYQNSARSNRYYNRWSPKRSAEFRNLRNRFSPSWSVSESHTISSPKFSARNFPIRNL